MAFSWAAALKSEQTIVEQCRRCQRCCVSADGCPSHAAYRFDSSVTSVGLDIAVLGMVDGIWIVLLFKLTIFPPAQLKEQLSQVLYLLPIFYLKVQSLCYRWHDLVHVPYMRKLIVIDVIDGE